MKVAVLTAWAKANVWGEEISGRINASGCSFQIDYVIWSMSLSNVGIFVTQNVEWGRAGSWIVSLLSQARAVLSASNSSSHAIRYAHVPIWNCMSETTFMKLTLSLTSADIIHAHVSRTRNSWDQQSGNILGYPGTWISRYCKIGLIIRAGQRRSPTIITLYFLCNNDNVCLNQKIINIWKYYTETGVSVCWQTHFLKVPVTRLIK